MGERSMKIFAKRSESKEKLLVAHGCTGDIRSDGKQLGIIWAE